MHHLEPLHFPEAGFSLPGNPATDEYLLPVSGGADSSVLAILLHRRFPTIPFRLVFTDTLCEPASTYQALDRLEAYLGKKIERVMPKLGLFELIAHYNGFLPSAAGQRYCTRELKLVSFQKWIGQFADKTKWMFIGIRADEADRLAFAIPEVETVFPFVEMGVGRDMVFKILSETVGIASTYRYRSRSGCFVCPFQTRQELVGLLQFSPSEFARGQTCEKVDQKDLARWIPAEPLWTDSGLAENWQNLPLPSKTDSIEGKNRRGVDLFGSRIFVAAEFFFDGFPGGEEFCWHQRLVSVSPTLHGLKQQIDGRYQHLLGTGEVYDMTPEDVKRQVRFVIYLVELPADVFDPTGPTQPAYTWQQGWAYAQLKHVVSWVTRALNAESMRRESARKVASELSVLAEWRDAAKRGLNAIRHEVGGVIRQQWYQPQETKRELDEDELLATLPCPMCNI